MIPHQIINIPTPTPFADTGVTLPVEIPEITLWDYTDEAIQIWNSVTPYDEIFKVMLLIAIVGLGVMALVALSNAITKTD